jgi:hypothetical protein
MSLPTLPEKEVLHKFSLNMIDLRGMSENSVAECGSGMFIPDLHFPSRILDPDPQH